MAIVRFSFDESKVPAGAVNVEEVQHGANHYWTWHEFVGLCLSDGEYNGYDDSDFYMTIWDAEKAEPFRYTYASTRGWTYPAMASFPDATPEVKAAYREYLERLEEEREERRQIEAAEARQREAEEAKPGRECIVFKGRKVPVGTKGRCFYRGTGKYGERVGLTTAQGETVWTAAQNVRAIEA